MMVDELGIRMRNMNGLQSIDTHNRAGDEPQLIVSGVLVLEEPSGACAIVERGMPILSRDGQEMGKVTAVRVDGNQVVEAILLSRIPLKMEYHIVPAGSIVTVRGHEVILDLTVGGIDGLEIWSTA